MLEPSVNNLLGTLRAGRVPALHNNVLQLFSAALTWAHLGEKCSAGWESSDVDPLPTWVSWSRKISDFLGLYWVSSWHLTRIREKSKEAGGGQTAELPSSLRHCGFLRQRKILNKLQMLLRKKLFKIVSTVGSFFSFPIYKGWECERCESDTGL